MNFGGILNVITGILFVIRGCHCSCADSSKVATMCRDNTVSGTQLFIDTDLAGTLVLPSGVACTCQVATQVGKKLEVYTMFFDQGTPGVLCGTAVEFITNSSNKAVPCYDLPLTYDVGTFNNMTVDFRRNRSPYLSTYCVRLTLTYCQSNQYQCDDGSCIPKSEVCDNIGQCPDEDDELNCGGSCSEGQILCDDRITCYDPALRCDGTPQCPDGSDEASCGSTTAPDTGGGNADATDPLITISCEESAYFPTTTTTTTSTTTTPTTTTTVPTTTTTTSTTTTTIPTTTSTTPTTTTTTPTTSKTTPTMSSTTITTPTSTTPKTTSTSTSTTTTPIISTTTPSTTTTTPSSTTATPTTSTTISTTSTALSTTTTTTVPPVVTTTTETPSSSSTVSTTTLAPTNTSKPTTAEPTTPTQSTSTLSQPTTTTTAAVPSPTTQRKVATTEEDDDDDNKVLIVGIVSGVLALILLIVCIIFWFRSKDWSKKGKGEIHMKRFSPEGEEPPTHAWYPADGEPSYTVNTMYVRDDTINIQDVYDAEARNEPVYSYPKKKKKEFMLYSL